MARDVTLTDEQMEHLRRLMLLGDAALKPKRLRRLQIIEMLCRGRPGKEIAASITPPISVQAVSSIRQDLLDGGLSREITKFEDEIAKFLVEKAMPPPARGRPGFQVLEDFEESVEISDEPIFEVASLIVGTDVSVAVIAVRASKHVHEDLVSEAHAYAVNPQQKWTPVSARDQMLRSTISLFREGAVSMDSEASESAILVKDGSPVEFRDGFGLYVLAEGDLAKRAEALSFLGLSNDAFTVISAYREGGFFDRFEEFLFTIRARYSCIGFLPTLRELYDRGRRWNADSYEGPFVWAAPFKRMELWMKYRAVVRTHFAYNGFLFELNPWLWDQIPYREEVKYQTNRLRPKIRVAATDHEAGTVTLLIEPLPEVGFGLTIPFTGEPEDLARVLRQHLASRNPASHSVYSAKPRQIWQKPPSGSEGASPVDVRHLKEVRKSVLIPRHFLCPGPELSIEMLVELSKDATPAVRTISTASDEGELNIMAGMSASILESFDEAFRLNRYGDIHRELRLHQGRQVLYEKQFRGSVNQYRLESLELLNLSSGPYYHMVPTDPATIDTKSILHDRIAHRLEVLEMKPEIPPWEDPYIYDAERTFSEVLTDFDADFLLSQISEAAQTRLDQEAETWGEAVNLAIVQNFTHPGANGLDFKSIRSLAPSWARKPDDDFSDAFMDALSVFRKSRERCFIRGAIENAQRLALAGRKPVAIAAEYEEDILRAWRSFLSQSLKGRFTDLYHDEKERKAALRVETEIEHPRPARRRYTESD